MPYVYILRCRDGSYYTGYAMDIDKRLAEHQTGTACKYTRGRTPVELIYLEETDSKSEALQREYQIKRLNKKQKENLIRNYARGSG
jgi:putative endonuclease